MMAARDTQDDQRGAFASAHHGDDPQMGCTPNAA
jgi:hypothetical protein